MSDSGLPTQAEATLARVNPTVKAEDEIRDLTSYTASTSPSANGRGDSTMIILVVDDNEQDLDLLQVLLGGDGYQVVTAVNGAEALAKARLNPPDLIVSDILMPVMDGFALCRECKKDERLRQIPFVFYTATYTDERDRTGGPPRSWGPACWFSASPFGWCTGA